jgi:hypothetical protein
VFAVTCLRLDWNICFWRLKSACLLLPDITGFEQTAQVNFSASHTTVLLPPSLRVWLAITPHGYPALHVGALSSATFYSRSLFARQFHRTTLLKGRKITLQILVLPLSSAALQSGSILTRAPYLKYLCLPTLGSRSLSPPQYHLLHKAVWDVKYSSMICGTLLYPEVLITSPLLAVGMRMALSNSFSSLLPFPWARLRLTLWFRVCFCPTIS